eukprot:SAG11_NODE_436_length_9485_cov_2.971447_1_plen_364_part_10
MADKEASTCSWRLYWSPNSSASLRVVLAFKAKGLSPSLTECVSSTSPDRGSGYECIDDSSGKLVAYTSINPEGRIPALVIHGGGDGEKEPAAPVLITQAAAILEYLEEAPEFAAVGPRLLPPVVWERARVRQICWIIGADAHPLQNMGMLRTAIAEFGLLDLPMQNHPFRVHFLTTALAALDQLLVEIAAEAAAANPSSGGAGSGDGFCVGGSLSLADLFLVPQVRNALGAGLDISTQFPAVQRVWRHCIGLPFIRATLEACGGIIQPSVGTSRLRAGRHNSGSGGSSATGASAPSIRGVLLDIGGVIADSPIVAIRRYCAARGLPDLNRFLGSSQAWNGFMRGQLQRPAYDDALAAELAAAGG